MSQSPQAGQFNSYRLTMNITNKEVIESLNPLKRVNSILTISEASFCPALSPIVSQSPQAGQFNSYETVKHGIYTILPIVSIPSSGSIQFLPEENPASLLSYVQGLNPLKRVNSILT